MINQIDLAFYTIVFNNLSFAAKTILSYLYLYDKFLFLEFELTI